MGFMLAVKVSSYLKRYLLAADPGASGGTPQRSYRTGLIRYERPTGVKASPSPPAEPSPEADNASREAESSPEIDKPGRTGIRVGGGSPQEMGVSTLLK